MPKVISYDPTAFSFGGVRYQMLEKLSKLVNPEWTTTDVCTNLIKPWTIENCEEGLSFEIYMNRFYFQSPHPQLGLSYKECFSLSKVSGEMSEPATIFISHAWSYKWKELMNAIKTFEEQESVRNNNDGIERLYWIDLFVNLQHKTINRPFEWWSRTFKESIGKIGKTVLILCPWDEPRPLKRAWCLWEIVCTIITKSELILQFSKEQELTFKQRLFDDFEVILKVLSNIDVEKAQCYDPKDQKRILSAVKALDDGDGIHYVNVLLSEKMRKWLLASTKSILDTSLAKLAKESSNSEKQFHYYSQINSIASALIIHSQFEEAADLYQICIDGYTTLGLKEDDLNLVTVMSNLASTLSALDQPQQTKRAGQLFKKVLEVRRAKLGHDLLTATSYQNLGAWCYDNHQLEEARALYHECCTMRIEILGDNHIDTIAALSYVAVIDSELGFEGQAAEVYERIFSVVDNGVFEDDSSANSILAHVRSSYSIMLFNQGTRLDEALIHCELALRQYEVTYGSYHPSTGHQFYVCSTIYEAKGNYKKAIAMCERALSVYRKVSPGESDEKQILESIDSLKAQLAKTQKAWGLGLMMSKVVGKFKKNTSIATSDSDVSSHAGKLSMKKSGISQLCSHKKKNDVNKYKKLVHSSYSDLLGLLDFDSDHENGDEDDEE